MNFSMFYPQLSMALPQVGVDSAQKLILKNPLPVWRKTDRVDIYKC